MIPLINRARALLAQPEPVIPVKQQIFPTPSQAAECGGPCYAGGYCPEACDCGLYQPPALAQLEPEGPTDEEIEEWADACPEAPLEEMDPEVHGWRRCFTAKEFSETIRAALDRWGRPTPQPEEADIHYSWELHDAEGEWQAGGSAITLESVRREGNHYLQTYSQDGPHTLIIYQASTIEVVTND
jgi:hypothetical protein